MPSPRVRAALLWSCMQVLTRERFDALLRAFTTLELAAQHIDGELLRGLGCRQETISNVLERMEKCDPEKEEQLLESVDAQIVTYGDDQYPDCLKDMADPPMFLYARGDLSILRQPCVSLVGTRNATPYGRRIALEFTQGMTRAGMVTVSGLARGIDSLVAEETIKSGGKTVAVLGQGLLTLSSRSKGLEQRIVDAGGLILSEFPLRTAPDFFTFPLRNRIIAGLGLATVVLEAPQSSGALITATLAFDYGRDVFAVPGQIFDANFAGCHAIIHKHQARIAASPKDVLVDLGVVVPEDDAEQCLYLPQNADEEKIYDLLTGMAQPVDDLALKSGMDASVVGATLTMLELNGAARNLGNGQWVRQ